MDPRKRIKRLAQKAFAEEMDDVKALQKIHAIADNDELWEEEDDENYEEDNEEDEDEEDGGILGAILDLVPDDD